jgi:hypothetical protein
MNFPEDLLIKSLIARLNQPGDVICMQNTLQLVKDYEESQGTRT